MKSDMPISIHRRFPAVYSAHSLGYDSSIISCMKAISERWSYKIEDKIAHIGSALGNSYSKYAIVRHGYHLQLKTYVC